MFWYWIEWTIFRKFLCTVYWQEQMQLLLWEIDLEMHLAALKANEQKKHTHKRKTILLTDCNRIFFFLFKFFGHIRMWDTKKRTFWMCCKKRWVLLYLQLYCFFERLILAAFAILYHRHRYHRITERSLFAFPSFIVAIFVFVLSALLLLL